MAAAAARSAVTRRSPVIAMRMSAEGAAVTVVARLMSTPSPGSPPERTWAERPGSPWTAARSTAEERTEGGLDRRDGVLRGRAGPVGPAGPLGIAGT